MLQRRGVIAQWEPKRSASPVPNLYQIFHDAMSRAQLDANALVYAEALALAIDDVPSSPTDWVIKARFLTLRDRGASPIAYNPAVGLASINIPPDSYIADVMHLVVMANGCLVFDRHKDGPTLGALSEYFQEHLRAKIQIVSLYNRDLKRELEELSGRLRKVEIGFLSEKVDVSSEGLLGNLKALSLGERIPSVSVTLSVGRTRNKGTVLPEDLQGQAMELAGDAGELIERMKLYGFDQQGNRREINVLRQRIGEKLEFKPDPNEPTMPDATDAYDKLITMYEQFRSGGIIESALRPELLQVG
jgi:hypothetical protein